MNESLSKLPSPEVSVIIPAYNLEGYLDTCLQSVLAQTLGNFEAIVVDDGSTDGTPGLLRRYAERDPRIIVVSTPNRGVARARETGIARAQGKLSRPEKGLQKRVNLMQQTTNSDLSRHYLPRQLRHLILQEYLSGVKTA
uniref:glycosyltransferase family 2 protein n=1 Tax=Alistipes putredinis TaxID=28117 RepID=UPI003AB1430B